MGNFNSIGVPTEEQCITSTIPPEMTVRATYLDKFVRKCDSGSSTSSNPINPINPIPIPFKTMTIKGSSFKLSSIFKQLKKYGGITDPSSTFENVSIFIMIEIFPNVPIFIDVDVKNRNNPLPVYKTNGWNILFGSNISNDIYDWNESVLGSAVSYYGKKNIPPGTRDKLLSLYITKVAERNVNWYGKLNFLGLLQYAGINIENF
jgi:hypothetical protein